MTICAIKTVRIGNNFIGHQIDTKDDSTSFVFRGKVIVTIDSNAKLMVGKKTIGNFRVNKDGFWDFVFRNDNYKSYHECDLITTTERGLLEAEQLVLAKLVEDGTVVI